MIDTSLSDFISVVEKGSFSAAAESLYISQPALSQKIRTLEARLGFELFRHETRRAVLTEAGKAFYPRAKQLAAVYENAVQEGLFIARSIKIDRQRLRIGCLEEQIFTVWMKLFRLTEDIMKDYAPMAMRFASRAELYSALLHREVDLTFQMENEDIAAFGLEFMPVVHVPELCIPLLIKRSALSDTLSPSGLSLQELARWRVAFHYERGHTLYEDALRRILSGSTASLLEPEDFFNAPFGIPTMLLVPQLSLTSKMDDYAFPLLWGQGISAGFVYAPGCEARVLDYAKWIRDFILENGNPWE